MHQADHHPTRPDADADPAPDLELELEPEPAPEPLPPRDPTLAHLPSAARVRAAAQADPIPAGSTLREIPDPDAVAAAPPGPPPGVLIVTQRPAGGFTPGMALATGLLVLALGGLAARGLVDDWQGLLTESRTRWTTLKPAPPPAVAQAQAEPAWATAPETLAPAARPEATASTPVPDDLVAAAPRPDPEPEPLPRAPALPERNAPKPAPDAPEAAAPAPSPPAHEEDTKAALADIEKEVERKRKEQAELEALRQQAERNAPPPARAPLRRFGFGVPLPQNPREREQLARMIREQQMRHLREMERMFDAMERAQAEAFRAWPPAAAPIMPRRPRPNFGMVQPPPAAPPFRGDARRFAVPPPPRPGNLDLDPPPGARDPNWPNVDPRRPNDDRARPAKPNDPMRGWQANAAPGARTFPLPGGGQAFVIRW